MRMIAWAILVAMASAARGAGPEADDLVKEGLNFRNGTNGYPRDRTKALSAFKASMDSGNAWGQLYYADVLHEGSAKDGARAESILKWITSRESGLWNTGVGIIARETLRRWHPVKMAVPGTITTVEVATPRAPGPSGPKSSAVSPGAPSEIRTARWAEGTQFETAEIGKRYQLVRYDSTHDAYTIAYRTPRDRPPGYWVGERRFSANDPLLSRLRVVTDPVRFCTTCGGAGVVNTYIRHPDARGWLDVGQSFGRYQGVFDDGCGACRMTGLAP